MTDFFLWMAYIGLILVFVGVTGALITLLR